MNGNRLRDIRRMLDALPLDPDKCRDDQDRFDRVEEVAIQVLDGQFAAFPDGVLEDYLLTYLHLRRYEYGLVDLDSPEPVER